MKFPWVETAFLLLGWILGILAGPAQDYLRHRAERKQLKMAIWTELSDLRERLALAAFTIEIKRDGFSKELLIWLRKYTLERTPWFPAAHLPTVTKRLADLSDEQLSECTRIFSQLPGGLALKRYELRYLTSKLDRLDLLPETVQEHLLAILTHLDFINQTIDDTCFYRELTFSDSISEQNHQIATAELARCRDSVANHARALVKMIDGLELTLTASHSKR